MAPRARAKNESGEQSRRRILDAAEQLLAREGFSAMSIAKLEKQSGLPASSIYWHFRDKRGVLLAVMDRGAQRFFDRLTHAEATDGAPAERVQVLLSALAQQFVSEPLFLALLLSVGSERGAGPEAAERIRAIRAAGLEHAKAIGRLVAEAADRVVGEDTVDAMGRMTMAVNDGAVFALQLGEPIDLEATYQRLGVMLTALAEAAGRRQRGPSKASAPQATA